MIQKEEISVDDIFAAVGKLEIISITLDPGDNAQLIFESLNSTGLALTEGDKIRNYILMGLNPLDQSKYYDAYWAKIERCTKNDVSGFVRDYLSIKQLITPTINHVYRAFKGYAETAKLPVDVLLADLLRYARFFEKLLTCKSGLNVQELDDCLYRMMRLDIVVTRPFLMEVLRLHQDRKLTADEVLRIFLVTENYLFRRNICEVPTNALNKIFLNLNKEILRYDNTTDNYVQKFVYALLSKKESGRFPCDDEFTAALATKQVYQMRGKYKAYLFERFENYGTVETKDVYNHLDKNTYTIEHIMPQHLTPAWKKALGANASEIHAMWLHRLANLTLTGYNPSLSNKSFQEKRDAQEGGYKASGLKMNQMIAQKESWGLPELEERNEEMMALALKIWAYPDTSFVPDEKEFDSCTLDDEDVDLTGREIAKYSYQNAEQPVSSWLNMFEHVVKFLHQKDKSVLAGLAYSSSSTDLSSYVSTSEDGLRNALKIDENIFVERNTSTALKISILRRLFALYDDDPMDLVFYLKDTESEKVAKAGRYELRKRYWTYALPIIQKQNAHRGTFEHCNPNTSNTMSGYFGINGFNISCIANYDSARIDFYLGKDDAAKNKATFDILLAHKDEIEDKLGVSLTWERANAYKASWLCYRLHGVGITNETDWPRMAKFHAEWSDKICNAILPYLQESEDGSKQRVTTIAGILREWTVWQPAVNENLTKCNRTYTRFTTDGMSEILPDIPDAPSGWNTDNHYFYEIVNRTGKSFYIQCAVSSRNIPDDFRAICNRINELYPAKSGKEDWQWRTHFKSTTMTIGDELSKEEIFSKLNQCLEEIMRFEDELRQRLEE